jgi:hypothetical protein
MSDKIVNILISFFIGLIIGSLINFNPKKATVTKIETKVKYDTLVQIKKEFVKVPIEKIRYYTLRDTTKNAKNSCLSFPIIMEDSSKIQIEQCSKIGLPNDISINAEYLDKKEKTIFIEKAVLRTDTVHTMPKRLGFTIGPSIGAGYSLQGPVVYAGISLTYGWRF